MYDFDYYIKQPMQIVELQLNMIVDNIPHLIKTLDGGVNHPLIRKASHLPNSYYHIVTSFLKGIFFIITVTTYFITNN